jgi:DNA-binding transcriptional ArsR family regulator
MLKEWSDPAFDLVTDRLALIGDPTRIRLLALLEQGEATVQQLSDQLPSTPQNISRHLGILYRSGIVARQREGTTVRYCLVDYSACRLLEQTLASISGQLDQLADVAKLAA